MSNYDETKKKVIHILDKLQSMGFNAARIVKEIQVINPALRANNANISRFRDKNYKYRIIKIDDYLRCLEAIIRSQPHSEEADLYFVGYFLDNDLKPRRTILEIWLDTKKIKLSFIGKKTVYREGFFQINVLDKSIAFTTKDDKGENHSLILTHDNGEDLKNREKMPCVYAARFMRHTPVGGTMYFHKCESWETCVNAAIPSKTAYLLSHKRYQTLNPLAVFDETAEKISAYVGVYKGYYFPEKDDLSKVRIAIGEITADANIKFKLLGGQRDYTGLVKVSNFADNLVVGIEWDKDMEFYRYNWVLERGNFHEDDILRGVYSGIRFADNRPTAGKMVLIKQRTGELYDNLTPYHSDFETIPSPIQPFLKGEKYPFIDIGKVAPHEELDSRIQDMEGTYICYKIAATNGDLLCYPMKISKNGEIEKKGEHGYTQSGRASTFNGGSILSIAMQTETRRNKIYSFLTHKLFYIGQYTYAEIEHVTGVGTSTTNDEGAARFGREVLVRASIPFEDLIFERYDLKGVPKDLSEIARYFYGKTDNLIVDSPSRVNKPLIQMDNMGKRYFEAACYNAMKQNYTIAKTELVGAYKHFFPNGAAEIRELQTEFEGCLAFLKEDEEVMEWFGRYF